MAMRRPSDTYEGTLHKTTKCGYAKIIKYNGVREVTVQFVNTGCVITVQMGQLRRGVVYDRLIPRYFGVGYVGCGKFKTGSKGKPNLMFQTWVNMIERCYSSSYHMKRPTYKDCAVCDEWHNFQNFAEWYQRNYPDDGKKYQLDKDKLFNGNKLYSPRTCTFLSALENNQLAHEKTHTFINPHGDRVNITNLSKFCRENGYHISGFKKMKSGKYKSYRGWTNPT